MVNTMLRSLEIQNFKGIKQGKIDDLAQVNILVGRNNSGKSTILDALILLRSAIIGQDYLEENGIQQILSRRVDRGRGNFNYDELWYGMRTGANWNHSRRMRRKMPTLRSAKHGPAVGQGIHQGQATP